MIIKLKTLVINTFRKLNGGLIIVVALAFTLGWQFGYRDYHLRWINYKPQVKIANQLPANKNVNIDFKLFWDTWDLVSSRYIDKTALDPQKLYYGAIAGMVAAIGDPYTVFLPPNAQKTAKEQLGGSFEGVGMQLGYSKDKRLVVISPLKDTPAYRAGISAGELILQIDSRDTTNLSLPEAVGLIRGPKGTTVALQMYRENDSKPREIKLTRDTITVKSVEFESKVSKSGKKIALIRISTFGEKTRSEWDEAVREALASAPEGVIVDVRNNPGGFLDAAAYIASEFLDGGIVVMQEDYLREKQEQSVMRAGKLLKLPMVVLINKGSASASEILAGAMQDRKRATVVGEQSFGKGTIQSTQDLSGGTGIHITTAKWLTPDGRWIHNIGLTPDVKVDLPVASNSAEKTDTQLDKALDLLN